MALKSSTATVHWIGCMLARPWSIKPINRVAGAGSGTHSERDGLDTESAHSSVRMYKYVGASRKGPSGD